MTTAELHRGLTDATARIEGQLDALWYRTFEIHAADVTAADYRRLARRASRVKVQIESMQRELVYVKHSLATVGRKLKGAKKP